MADGKNKMVIEKIIKYGVEVYADVEMDNLRRERCLCLNCSIMNSGCETAKELYESAKKNNLAMMITRCRTYVPK